MNKLAKIATKYEIKPELARVMFKGGKIVVTDSFKLLEIETENKGLDVLIKAKDLKAGDTVNTDGTITRKDGSIFTPVTMSTETYPDYNQIMPTEKQLSEYNKIKINADYLVDLLQAMPKGKHGHVDLYVHKEDCKKMIYITGEKSKGLIMPITN